MSLGYVFEPGTDWTEDVQHYRAGGFHPIEINDTFKNGRYVVLHKLGHGGFSTVWLAHDTNSDDRPYVALKILSVDASKNVHEIAVNRWLVTSCGSFDSTKITRLLDYFRFNGPNGRHTALVFELCGPSLDNILDYGLKIRPDVIRTLAKQITQLVKNCHDNDVAIGDLSTKNILLKLKNIHTLTPTDIYEHIGTPEPNEMIPVNKDEPFPACGPKSLYPSIDLQKGILPFIEPEVTLADLNEITYTGTSHEMSDSNRSLCVNDNFAGPEFLLDLESKHTKALDIWALACVFFKMRTMSTLLEGGCLQPSPDIVDIQHLMGPVPESFIAEVRAAETRLEEAIKAKEEEEGEEYCHYEPAEFLPFHELDAEQSLHFRLKSAGESSFFHRLTTEQKKRCILETTSESEREHDRYLDLEADPYAEPPPARFTRDEGMDLEDLLKKMLQYQPEDRLTITDILDHPWLNKEYQDLDDMAVPWLCRFTGGWQYRDAEEWYEEVIVNGGAWRRKETRWGPDSDDNEDNDEEHEYGHEEDDEDDSEDDSVSDRIIEQDENMGESDLNTMECHDLEHVFVWRREGHYSIKQPDDISELDLNTGECHYLQHVFVWRRDEDYVDDQVERGGMDLVTTKHYNLDHVFVGQREGTRLGVYDDIGNKADHTIDQEAQADASDQNTVDDGSLAQVVASQGELFDPQTEDDEMVLLEISFDSSQEEATPQTPKMTTERDLIDNKEENIEALALSPIIIADLDRVRVWSTTEEELAVDHDQNEGKEVSDLDWAGCYDLERVGVWHTGRAAIMNLNYDEEIETSESDSTGSHTLEQTGNESTIDHGHDEEQEAEELDSMQCNTLDNIFKWQRKASPWEIQGLSLSKLQDGRKQARALIVMKRHGLEEACNWRRKAVSWEVQGLVQRKCQGLVSFTKVVWNWTGKVEEEDVD